MVNTPLPKPAAHNTTLYLYVAAVVLIWSTAYTLMYYAVYSGGFPAEWIPAARTVFPAIAITIYVYMRGLKLPPLMDSRWLWYGLMGFLGMTAPFFLHARGHAGGVESGMAAILTNGATPLFAIILAHIFVNTERLTLRKSIGFIIGFIGVVFLNLPEELSWRLITDWQAQSLFLLAAFCFAMAAIVAKRAPDTQASVGAAIMLITAAITALFIALPSGLPSGGFSNGVFTCAFRALYFLNWTVRYSLFKGHQIKRPFYDRADQLSRAGVRAHIWHCLSARSL